MSHIPPTETRSRKVELDLRNPSKIISAMNDTDLMTSLDVCRTLAVEFPPVWRENRMPQLEQLFKVVGSLDQLATLRIKGCPPPAFVEATRHLPIRTLEEKAV